DRELRAALDAARVFARQFKHEVVERGPKVVNGVADRERQEHRNIREYERLITAGLCVVADNDIVLGFVGELVQQFVRLLHISFRPLESQFATSESGMEEEHPPSVRR